MTTKAQKIRVGIFATAVAALLAGTIIMFAGMRFWEARVRYSIVFDGSVMGLEEGAAVYLNGMRVGVVEEVTPAPEDLRKVRVFIEIRKDTPVKTDTVAVLQFAGITGLKVIDLRDGTAGAARLPEGQTIAQGDTVLDKFEKQAKTIVDQSTEMMQHANRVVANLEQITDPKQFAGIGEIMESSRVASANLASATAGLDRMVAENRVALNRTVEAVGETARSATQLLDGQVSQLVANGGDLVSQLKGIVTGNEGQLRAAMFDLRQASKSFKELAREVRQRPSRLLFSNAPADRKLP